MPATNSEREAALLRYQRVRAHTEALAAPLHPEDQVVQSMPDVSPTKWHRAHVTWFFETFILTEHAPGYACVDPSYRVLFNSYYEQIGEQFPRPRRGLVTRPTASAVGDYRAHVDAAMADLVEATDDDTWSQIAPSIELGLHHEQQHQELLLMDIKHVLSCNPLDPVYHHDGPQPATTAEPFAWVPFDGGLVEVGHDAPDFCFDNEQPRHTAYTHAFRIGNRCVTNREWIDFIDARGYSTPEIWLSDGWHTVCDEGWTAPLYWRREPDGSFTEFTLAGRRPVEPDAPVCHVSHYEADAFARWAGARLPTEFEWEQAASKRADVVHGLFSDVWEWTASAYLAYPGFRPAAGAIGEYNGKFMSGQMVLRGGACVTPPEHVRPTYRNFFPPGSRWMFGGLRLAADA